MADLIFGTHWLFRQHVSHCWEDQVPSSDFAKNMPIMAHSYTALWGIYTSAAGSITESYHW